MKSFLSFLVLFVFLSLFILPFWSQNCLAEIYGQDFTSKEYCDTLNTTAWWDTVAGQLKLYPFSIDSVGSFDTPSSAYRISVEGNCAFIADSWSGLSIVDISDPMNPFLLGNYDTDEAHDVVVEGDVAYLVDFTGIFYVIDVSDPTNPFSIGGYDVGSPIYSLEVTGDYAYVAGGIGIFVVDVSDPTTPTLAGGYTTSGSIDIAIAGDYAYTTNYESFTVFDITDPANPDSVYGWGTPLFMLIGVAVEGNTVFLSTASSEFGALDVTDPTNPVIGSAASLPDQGMFATITGDYAYVAYSTGIAVVDISDPLNPVRVNEYNLSAWEVTDVAVAGEFAYVAAGDGGIQVLRISDQLLPPLHAGEFSSNDDFRGVEVEGNYAFVGCTFDGVRVFDISDPMNPALVGSYNTDGYSWQFDIDGDYAYLADGGGGFKVFDISDPSSLSLIGNYATIGSQDNDVAVAGDYAYVADYTAGMYVLDISDPTNPDSVGIFDQPGVAWGVVVEGDLAYLAHGGAGLAIINISDPTQPTLAGIYNSPDNAMDVAVAGDFAYLADSFSGLLIIDVSNPSAPSLAGAYDTPDLANQVKIVGQYAYVADRNSGIHVIDISDPTNPELVASYNTPGECRGVAVAGDYAFVGDDRSGFHSFQVFERSRDIEKNEAQSVTLHTSGQVDRIKLTPFQTDSILWEVSADNGTHWEVIPDTAWFDLSYPGVELLMRATLHYTQAGLYPYCDSLAFELDAGIVSVLISSFESELLENGIKLIWDVTADEAIRGFNIYRGKGKGPTINFVNTSGLIAPEERQFVDTDVQPGLTYNYILGVVKEDGTEVRSRTLSTRIRVRALALFQNYPNPFNPSTTISFTVPTKMYVNLSIFNPDGKLVRTLVDRKLSDGLKKITWDGTDAKRNPVSSGVYFYRLKAGDKVLTRKMVLVR